MKQIEGLTEEDGAVYYEHNGEKINLTEIGDKFGNFRRGKAVKEFEERANLDHKTADKIMRAMYDKTPPNREKIKELNEKSEQYKQQARERKDFDHSIPKYTLPLQHFKDDSFPSWGNKIRYKKENDILCFWDKDSKQKLELTVDKIISFYMIGDIAHNTVVKGGGTSIGGAVVGSAIAGPVGAIIGGHKKVKSTVQTVNTQTLIIKFVDEGREKGLKIFQPICIYEDLCYLCPEKKNYDSSKAKPEATLLIDIPNQIKKLADLKSQGILTEEEFTQKKTELLAKM